MVLYERFGSDQGRLRVLKAWEDIKELCARYFWNAVRKNIDGMVACFTMDGAFDARLAGGPHRAEGQQALHEYFYHEYFYLVMNVTPSPVPMGHDQIIEIDGDTATGTVVFDSKTGGKLGGGFSGYYRDTYRCVDAKRLFSQRIFDNYAIYPAQSETEIKTIT